MSAPAKPLPATPAASEPRVGNANVPIWLIILLFILLYWGMVYFDSYGGWFQPEVYSPYRSLAELQNFQPAPGEGPNLQNGKRVYEQVCGLCHQPDGMGKPGQFPPLVGSEWALGTPNRLIRIPLLGLNGPIQVKGQPWALSMAAMGAALSDQDLADALCYLRKSWGNNASDISVDQVAAIRLQLGARTQPLTADELLKIPEK